MKLYNALLKNGFPAHDRNIKPAESLTVADFKAHPVWEYLLGHEVDETMTQPVEKFPVRFWTPG